MAVPTCFKSFFMGGFECSTHRLPTGRRLDVIAGSRHQEFARQDYARMMNVGLRTARDGIRWHLIESSPGVYDFSSVRPMLDAARDTGIEIVWDLLHYGWPDDLDLLSDDFVARFAAMCGAFADLASRETEGTLWVVPVNEISFFAWAAGEIGIFNPFLRHRGDDVKRQLVRAAIAAIRAVRHAAPRARLVHTEPMINVVADPSRPEDAGPAEGHRQAQYAALDTIAGRREPELGGREDYIDVVGVNYYIHNQWVYPGGHGMTIEPSSPRYRPVSEMLAEVQARYGKPVFVAETGIENGARPAWLRYISHEVRLAVAAGVPVQGLCLYPILNHPGWDDDRHCHNGLWDYADETGHREPYEPLLRELDRQQELVQAPVSSNVKPTGNEAELLDVAAHWMEIRSGREDILHKDA